jgi:hypothetical protein
MKTYRWTIAIGLVLSFATLRFLSGGEVGFSMVQSGGKTVVSSSTHPIFMFWAVSILVVAWLLLRSEFQVIVVGSAGLVRRFLCFLIDFYALVIAEGSFLALIPLAVEAKRTGHFAWSFGRDYSVPSDLYILTPLALAGFLLLPAYIGWALIRGKPTVGGFVTGTFVKSVDDHSQVVDWGAALKWMFWAALGAGLWPYTLLRGRDKKGRTWYDRMSDCDVTHVTFQ